MIYTPSSVPNPIQHFTKVGISLTSKNNQASQNYSSPARQKVRAAQLKPQGAGMQLSEPAFAQKSCSQCLRSCKTWQRICSAPIHRQALVIHFISCSTAHLKCESRAVGHLGLPKKTSRYFNRSTTTSCKVPSVSLGSSLLWNSLGSWCKVGPVNTCYHLFWAFCTVYPACFKTHSEFIPLFRRNTSAG